MDNGMPNFKENRKLTPYYQGSPEDKDSLETRIKKGTKIEGLKEGMPSIENHETGHLGRHEA